MTELKVSPRLVISRPPLVHWPRQGETCAVSSTMCQLGPGPFPHRYYAIVLHVRRFSVRRINENWDNNIQ